jgi:hypothetical protein
MIIAALGIATSALYVGFLAYKIGAVPLWVIVVVTFALMIREFVVEYLGAANKEKRDARDARTPG